MARAVVAGGGERESERERGEGESKFFARTRTKFETKAPLALRFCSSPVAPYHPRVPLVAPQSGFSCMYVLLQMRALASATSSPWKLWRKSNSKCTGYPPTRKPTNLPPRGTRQVAGTPRTERRCDRDRERGWWDLFPQWILTYV